MTVALHLVRMVQSVWINMVATHVNALISGLVTTVQVYCILILAGYTCNSIGYTGMCEILNMCNGKMCPITFSVLGIPGALIVKARGPGYGFHPCRELVLWARLCQFVLCKQALPRT